MVAVATPAHAVTPSTIEELQAAFNNAHVDPTIVLSSDIFRGRHHPHSANNPETTTLTVEPAAAVSLDMTPSTLSVDEGGSLTLDLELLDAFGNFIPTNQVLITSDHSSDVIDGTKVTFPSASTHILTASYGALSATVSINVIPAAVVAVVAPGGLASTGFESGELIALAGLLLLLGAGAAVVSKRRLQRL